MVAGSPARKKSKSSAKTVTNPTGVTFKQSTLQHRVKVKGDLDVQPGEIPSWQVYKSYIMNGALYHRHEDGSYVRVPCEDCYCGRGHL